MTRTAAVLLSVVAVCAGGRLAAQQENGQLTLIPLRGDMYMIAGPEGNTTVQVGREGVLVVDPQPERLAEELLDAIAEISPAAVRLVINTSLDADRVAGNQVVARAGGALSDERSATVYGGGGAPIWAHENVLLRLSQGDGDGAGWPTDTYFVEQKDLFFNGEPVQLFHAPAAHSDGDSLVVFRRSDVVSAGPIYSPDRYPAIDIERGGSIDGLVDALNQLLRITVPEFNQQGGTLVVPGHGRLSDEADVAEYRDMVTIVRDRIQDMVTKGMTLEQVRGARPTFDYDGINGEEAGAVFVEQVYRSLSEGNR